MLLTKSIFPFWCAIALPIHSAEIEEIDILIGDIIIMANAIIINIMDIQRIHSSNMAIMPIIQRFYAINFVEFFF